jgi:hypothetical protein
MKITEWQLYVLNTPSWRPMNPARRRKRDEASMTNQKVLMKSQRVADTLPAVSDEELPVYQAMVRQFGDPFAPLVVPPLSRRATTRDKKRTGRLTQLVWDSLLPDGTVDPMKMVSAALVSTGELPMVPQEVAQEA